MIPKIIVGILYCGEGELSSCLHALEKQTYKEYDHFIISNKPDLEAHDTLYEAFEGSFHKIKLKLDADMILHDTEFLQHLLTAYDQEPKLARLVYDIHDTLSGIMIPCIQSFSSVCKWPELTDQLHPDRAPKVPKGYTFRRVRDHKNTCVTHMEKATPFQSFSYGLHSAIKMMQPDRSPQERSMERALYHFTVLQYIWRELRGMQHTSTNNALYFNRLTAIAGATKPFSTKLPFSLQDYKREPAKALYEVTLIDRDSLQWTDTYARELEHSLAELWDDPILLIDMFDITMKAAPWTSSRS